MWEGRGWRLAGQVETGADSEWDGRTMEGPSRAGPSLTQCAGWVFPTRWHSEPASLSRAPVLCCSLASHTGSGPFLM